MVYQGAPAGRKDPWPVPAMVSSPTRVRHSISDLQGRQVHDTGADPEVLLFKDGMPAFVFQSAFGPNKGDGRLDLFGLVQEHARLHIRTLVFVHVFSTSRRHNDLHSIIKNRVRGSTHLGSVHRYVHAKA